MQILGFIGSANIQETRRIVVKTKQRNLKNIISTRKSKQNAPTGQPDGALTRRALTALIPMNSGFVTDLEWWSNLTEP